MPDAFVPAIRMSELPPGSMRRVLVDRECVVLANVKGTVYALQDMCGHARAALSRGTLTGHVIECPLHFARFDVRDGKPLGGPMATDVPTYEVRVDGDAVYVRYAVSAAPPRR
jgi:nitrite reductase/ring-hydroxylating ferredoxin subunit